MCNYYLLIFLQIGRPPRLQSIGRTSAAMMSAPMTQDERQARVDAETAIISAPPARAKIQMHIYAGDKLPAGIAALNDGEPEIIIVIVKGVIDPCPKNSMFAAFVRVQALFARC